MNKNTQRLFAVGLVVIGGLMIMSNFLNISFEKVGWSLVIIFLGVLLVTKPEIFRGENIHYKFVHDKSLDESWDFQEYNVRAFVTELDLDLEFAEFPDGESNLQVSSFVGSITLTLPQDVGLKIKTNAFLTDSKIDGKKEEIFLSGLRYESEGYEETTKKLNIQLNGFVMEVKL